jgi:hypothetical protein
MCDKPFMRNTNLEKIMKNEQDNNQPIEAILGRETGSESLQFIHTRVAVA